MPPVTSRTAPTPSAVALAAPEATVKPCSDLADRCRPEFDRLFAPFAHVVLAVSGGADSLAMLHLCLDWRRDYAVRDHQKRGHAKRDQTVSPCTFSVVTVDHGLRPESAAEAASVADLCAALSVQHTTLHWNESKPAHGLQAAARQARYAIIARHLHEQGHTAVATAHTADDQAETVLMRLARGSGVDGLAAMLPMSRLPSDAALLRPLLGQRKSSLIAYLTKHGYPWCEDPSNQVDSYERVRVRRARTKMQEAGFGLDALAVARSAQRAARASSALSSMTQAAWAARGTHAEFSPYGYATVQWEWLLAQPEEVRIRLLIGLLDCVGGQERSASLGQLEAMTATRDWALPAPCTLNGTQWEHGNDRTLVITREVGRSVLPPVSLSPGHSLIWDRRFKIAAMLDAPLTHVGWLDQAGLLELRAKTAVLQTVPAKVAWRQPAVRDGDGRLLAVPTLGYAAPDATQIFACEAISPRFDLIQD